MRCHHHNSCKAPIIGFTLCAVTDTSCLAVRVYRCGVHTLCGCMARATTYAPGRTHPVLILHLDLQYAYVGPGYPTYIQVSCKARVLSCHASKSPWSTVLAWFNHALCCVGCLPLCRFKLDKRITFLGVAFYAAFQLGFVAIIIANETNKPSHGPHAP